MKNPQTKQLPGRWAAWVLGGVASVAALAIGLTRRARARASAALSSRWSRQDSEAVHRMEGEGGPPLATPPKPADLPTPHA